MSCLPWPGQGKKDDHLRLAGWAGLSRAPPLQLANGDGGVRAPIAIRESPASATALRNGICRIQVGSSIIHPLPAAWGKRAGELPCPVRFCVLSLNFFSGGRRGLLRPMQCQSSFVAFFFVFVSR